MELKKLTDEDVIREDPQVGRIRARRCILFVEDGVEHFGTRVDCMHPDTGEWLTVYRKHNKHDVSDLELEIDNAIPCFIAEIEREFK